jgi:hypothetical protein
LQNLGSNSTSLVLPASLSVCGRQRLGWSAMQVATTDSTMFRMSLAKQPDDSAQMHVP